MLRLAQILEGHWGRPSIDGALDEYARQTADELEATARLVAALYARMNHFETFTQLTLLYFAAASFAESARRLGRPELAGSFLFCRDARFAPLLFDCCRMAHDPSSPENTRKLRQQVRLAIQPIDVAGLSDLTRNNWFPAQTSDLLESCHKLGSTKGEISEMFMKCGLTVK